MNQENILAIANLLKGVAELERYRSDEEAIEAEIAYDLDEIIGSMAKILEELWPNMLAAKNVSAVGDRLFDIREELRHILYHIENSRYFSIICG